MLVEYEQINTDVSYGAYDGPLHVFHPINPGYNMHQPNKCLSTNEFLS